MKPEYRRWLVAQKYAANTVSAQVHRAARVEEFHGDLDVHFANDRMESLIEILRYSTDDARRNRPNPTQIPIEGDIRNNLASYRNAIERYRRFRESANDIPDETGVRSSATVEIAEEAGQRISLERDMQAALRIAIDQLDLGLTIIDDGAERSVESGFIDITARDASGAIVVIELKAGIAGQRAIGQILSYMGETWRLRRWVFPFVGFSWRLSSMLRQNLQRVSFPICSSAVIASAFHSRTRMPERRHTA
jgi:endonuclease